MIESLVQQIEARFADAQAQMSDPEVFGDRERFADARRLFNQLAPAAKLAEEWRLAVLDAAGAEEPLAEGEDPEMRTELRDARERIERLEEEIRLAMVERDPERREGRDRRDPRRHGRRGGRPLGGRPLPHAHALRRAPRLQDRDAGGRRRLVPVRDQGRRRVLGVQVRGRHAAGG